MPMTGFIGPTILKYTRSPLWTPSTLSATDGGTSASRRRGRTDRQPFEFQTTKFRLLVLFLLVSGRSPDLR